MALPSQPTPWGKNPATLRVFKGEEFTESQRLASNTAAGLGVLRQEKGKPLDGANGSVVVLWRLPLGAKADDLPC